MTDWADQIITSPGTPMPPPQSPTEDWADAITPPVSDIGRSLDVNLLSDDANKTTPERAARVLEAQKKTGLPINLVDSQLDTVEQEAKKQDFNAETFSKENPAVAKWMAENPQQTALGKEDQKNLSLTEQLLGKIKTYAEQTPRSLAASVMQMAGASTNIFRAFVDLRYLPSELASTLMGQSPDFGRKAFDIMDAGKTKNITGFLADQQNIANDWATYLRGDTSNMNETEQAVFSGIESLGQNLINLAAGIAFKNPELVLGLMSTQTAGTAYGQARDKNVSVAQSLSFAGAQGGIEWATELIPMMSVIKDIGLKSSLAKTILNMAPSELLGEQVATVLQDFNEWAVLSPEKPFSDYAEQRPAAAYQTLVATLVSVIGLTAGGHIIHRALTHADSKQNENFFKALGDVSKDSKLRERLPENYQTIVDNITKDGPVENVYTPIEFFQSHFQEAGIDPRAVAVELGIEKAYDEATQSGSKLAIPTGVYATKIAPTDNNAAFVKELALTPDGLTSREADDLKAEFEKAKQAEPTTVEQSLQKIREDVQGQLSAIMLADVAERQAMLWQERYRARAERLGMDPWTLYQQRPISFTSEIGGKQALPTDVPRGTMELAQTAQRMAGDFAKGHAITLTPNTVPGEGPYRVTHWLDGLPVRHEAFPDTTTAEKAFDQALKDTNTTAEQLGNQAITEQQTLFQRSSNRDMVIRNRPMVAETASRIAKERGLEVDEDGFITLYHATPHYRIIEKSGQLNSGAFFAETADVAKKQVPVRGVKILKIKADPRALFPGEYWTSNESLHRNDKGQWVVSTEQQMLFQKERGVTRFTDRTVNIGLFKDADLSTLLHESGHVFLLDMHGDVQYLRGLKELNAKQQGVIDDFNNVLKWLGITEQELLEQTIVDGKTTLSPKSVKANEQFARGMEAYLAEGKAPSIELRSAFQRFKAWMVQVYRLWKKDATISNELNVHLNDEVRAIMDRLLATDDQIKVAQADAEITPIFTDAASAGMSDIQFDAYRKTLEQESTRAKENLEQQLIKEYQRERQQQWKDEREKVRAKVDNEIGAIPIYGALDSLQSTEPGNIKLNRAAVIERYGKDRAKAMPVGIMDDNGIDPDTAAEMLGFKSGEDLTSQLASMQSRNKLIETETDRRMYETHGNILMDGGIVEKAKEAVRDSGRSEIIAEELKALQKKMREVKPFVEAAKKEDQQKQVAGRQIYLAAVPTVKEAHALAEQSIASSKVREIRPMQFFYAARKASKAAVEAMRKGDVLVAAVNKRQELIATEMYRAAVKAQKEIDKIVKNQKSFDKTSKRERIGKAGGDFLDQIDTLRARYNLHPQSEAAFAKKKASLREWYDEQMALGFVPGIDPDLLDESNRLDYRDATLDELRALNDAVNSIAFIASRHGQIATMQKQVAMKEAIAAMKDRADISLKKVDKKKERILKNWLDRSNDKIKGFDVSLVPMETIMEILDDGAIGPFHDYIFNLASEAQTAEYDLSKTLGEEIRKIVDEFVSEDTGRITDMFQTTLFPEPISRFRLISLAFNIGNESSFDKLVRGYGWQGREQEVMRTLKQLDVKDLKFIQKVWDRLDTLYPALNELQKKVSGLPLPRVEPRAVTISAKDGDITLKGGYYPAVYDPELSIQGTKQDTGPLAGLTERGYSSAVAPDSFRKGRTKYAGPMLLDFEHVLNSHITGVIKDLTHREFLIDMNRLFKNQEFRNIIHEHLGAEYGKMFMPWLKGVANDRNTGEINTAFDSLWEVLRSRVTVVALGYKVTSSLAQLSGYSNSIEYISDHYGSAYMASAMVKFLKNPLENYRLVSEKSGEMKHRYDTIDRDVRDELRKISAGKVGMMRAAIERAGFYGINFMDRMVSIPTWMAAYQGALDKGVTEQQAIHAGDAAVRRSQGAGGAKDLNTMQRKRGFNKILTLFYTPFAAWYGRLRQIKSNLKQQGWKYTPEAIMHVAMITLIQSALSEILAGRGPTQKCDPDDLECMGKWLAAKSISSLTAPVPVLRDIGNTIESYIQSGRMQDTRYSPVLDAISKIGKTGIRTGEALFGDREFDEELAFNLFETSGYFMGLPTAQPRITLQYLYDLMNDETSPETPMEFLHGLAYRRVR